MKYINAIIIEGPDCSGKTTLAKWLNEYYTNLGCDMSIMHCTGHDPADCDFYYQLLRKKNVIYDRHFIGERIYPRIFNREPQLSEDDYFSMCRKTAEMKIPVIVVAPPSEVLISRLKNERPNEETEIVNTILYARDQFYSRGKRSSELFHNFILVDPEDGNINFEELVKKIDNILEVK